MKTQIKWINESWRAFEDDRSHFSAGIGEICDLVEASMKEKYLLLHERKIDITWECDGRKLTALPDTSAKKMAKSDQ